MLILMLKVIFEELLRRLQCLRQMNRNQEVAKKLLQVKYLQLSDEENFTFPRLNQNAEAQQMVAQEAALVPLLQVIQAIQRILSLNTVG